MLQLCGLTIAWSSHKSEVKIWNYVGHWFEKCAVNNMHMDGYPAIGILAKTRTEHIKKEKGTLIFGLVSVYGLNAGSVYFVMDIVSFIF